jgi:hypothetical protein
MAWLADDTARMPDTAPFTQVDILTWKRKDNLIAAASKHELTPDGSTKAFVLRQFGHFLSSMM